MICVRIFHKLKWNGVIIVLVWWIFLLQKTIRSVSLVFHIYFLKNWKICGISRLVMMVSENIWNMNIMAWNQPWFPQLILYVIQGEERFKMAYVFVVVHCYLMFYFWEFSERENWMFLSLLLIPILKTVFICSDF